ncbi:MAG TPA: cation:proton antiporter [Nitrospiraceae bacterium]|nr:cation:proton antiporter [Nitrospiraceae bacterium]
MSPYLHLSDIVLAITVLLMISAVVIPLARRFGIGPELGLLVSGVILGSSHVLGPTQVERLREVSELGVVFFLFIIGLELDFRRAWSLRRYALGLGPLQILATGLVLMVYWRLFAPSWSLALLLGLVLANSSTALVFQILERKHELDQEHGQAAFAVLLFQDLTVVPILALIPVFAGTGSTDLQSWWNVLPAIGLMAVVFFIGREGFPVLFRLTIAQDMKEAFTAVLFVGVLGSAWLASRVGLSMAVGAFLMGVALSSTEYRRQLREEVMPLKNLLLGLFFVSVGLSMDVSVLSEHTTRLLMHVLAIITAKIAVLYLAARAFKMAHGPAARLSFLLAQAGEFGFVILGTLLISGVVTPTQFANGIMVIALTTILTSWLDYVGMLWSRWEPPAIKKGTGAPT